MKKTLAVATLATFDPCRTLIPEQLRIWLSHVVSDKLATGKSQVQMRADDPALTERERQMFDAIACGWRNGRIADQLSLTEKTVRQYVSNLYAKVGVTSRSEAIIWAKERGFGVS